MIDLLLNKFLNLLESEEDLCDLLLLTLQKETMAVVDSDLEALNGTNKEKESLVLKIRILEEQRVQILSKVSEHIGCTHRDLTLDNLSELLDEPFSARLKGYNSRFSALMQTVCEVNEGNKGLIMHSMDLVGDSLNLLENLISPNPVYYRTGKFQNSDQGGMFLSDMI